MEQEYDPVLLEYMAAIQSMCDHEKCAPDWAEMIFGDAALYWTDADAAWLLVMCELIEARRELEFTRLDLQDAESELAAKRLPWWRRWL